MPFSSGVPFQLARTAVPGLHYCVCVCAKDWQMLTALPNEQLMKVTFYRGTQNNEICSYRSKGVILSPLQCIIKLGLESKIKKNKQSKTQFKAVQKKP